MRRDGWIEGWSKRGVSHRGKNGMRKIHAGGREKKKTQERERDEWGEQDISCEWLVCHQFWAQIKMLANTRLPCSQNFTSNHRAIEIKAIAWPPVAPRDKCLGGPDSFRRTGSTSDHWRAINTPSEEEHVPEKNITVYSRRHAHNARPRHQLFIYMRVFAQNLCYLKRTNVDLNVRQEESNSYNNSFNKWQTDAFTYMNHNPETGAEIECWLLFIYFFSKALNQGFTLLQRNYLLLFLLLISCSI